jgi:hypothetical protein
MLRTLLTAALLSGTPLMVDAKLLVKVDEPKIVGKKSVIKLTIKNTFKEKIESARAQIFLLDDQGKVVGQSAQWVIGGTKSRNGGTPLAPDASTSYNFVIETSRNGGTFTQSKLTFARIILEGGKSVDPSKGFEIEK